MEHYAVFMCLAGVVPGTGVDRDPNGVCWMVRQQIPLELQYFRAGPHLIFNSLDECEGHLPRWSFITPLTPLITFSFPSNVFYICKPDSQWPNKIV